MYSYSTTDQMSSAVEFIAGDMKPRSHQSRLHTTQVFLKPVVETCF